jgi:hypothetical protein
MMGENYESYQVFHFFTHTVAAIAFDVQQVNEAYFICFNKLPQSLKGVRLQRWRGHY